MGQYYSEQNPKVTACSLEQVSNVNTVNANMPLSKYARCVLSAFLLGLCFLGGVLRPSSGE